MTHLTLSLEQIEFLDEYVKGKWEIDPLDGSINVFGNFLIYKNSEIEDFLDLKFGKVTGNFWLCGVGMNNLVGAPKVVEGDFTFISNKHDLLLEHSPNSIGGNFIINNVYFNDYSLKSFQQKVNELYMQKLINHQILQNLMSHHFFTLHVLKDLIVNNRDGAYIVSILWNTPKFKNMQLKLKDILPENLVLKIDDLWSIGGYL